MYARSAEPSQPLQHMMMAPNRQRMPQQPMVLHSGPQQPQQHGYDGGQMMAGHRHSYDGAMMAAPQHSYGGPMSPHQQSYGQPMQSPHSYGGQMSPHQMSPHQHSYGPPMSSPHGHGYGGQMSPHQGYGMQMGYGYDQRVAPEPCYAQPPQAAPQMHAPQAQNMANNNTNTQAMAMNQATNVQVNIGGLGGKERVNHCCHCMLTTLTMGIWCPFWIAACTCGQPTLANCPCGN